MKEEYKNKLKERGVDVQKLPVVQLWTSEDGRWITPVMFGLDIFDDAALKGGINNMMGIMNERIQAKYDLLEEEFSIYNYFGNGMMRTLTAIVLVDKGSAQKVMSKSENWCN